MGVTETLRILLTIFLSTACIQNVRLFGVYDVHWPFLIEIHTAPLKRFVPSSVLQAVRALRNALAALAVFLAGVAPVHIISCDLQVYHCKHLITHLDFMISIKRFSIHMFVSHPHPNPAHLKEQWRHGFVDSLSPKHKDIYGLTLSQVNPRPQRGLHNFNMIDKIIFIY